MLRKEKKSYVHIEDPSIVTIDGAKLSLDPGEGAIVVDGNVIGSVLELGDEDEPHVDDHVGAEVQEGDSGGAKLVGEEGKEGNRQANTNVGENDIRALLLGEEGRPGRKVVDILEGLPLLVGSNVLGEVEGPAKDQMLEDGEGHVELGPWDLSGHFLGSGRDVDLILAHVVGVQVVAKSSREQKRRLEMVKGRNKYN